MKCPDCKQEMKEDAPHGWICDPCKRYWTHALLEALPEGFCKGEIKDADDITCDECIGRIICRFKPDQSTMSCHDFRENVEDLQKGVCSSCKGEGQTYQYDGECNDCMGSGKAKRQ